MWQAYQYWWGVQLQRWLIGRGSATRVAVFPASWKSKIGPDYLEPFEPITAINMSYRQARIVVPSRPGVAAQRTIPIAANDVRKIKWLPFLNSLYLTGELEPEVWEAVGELRQLKTLLLTSRQTSGLTHLEKLNRLEELYIGVHRAMPLSDTRVIATLPELRKLHLRFDGGMGSNVRFSPTIEQHMQELAASRTLTRIEASIPDDSVLLALTDRLPNGDFPLIKVNELRLSESKISNAGLANLHNVANLVHLDLSQTDVDDDGLDSIKSIPTLRTLYFAGCYSITDKAAEDLAKMTGLESLNVAGTRLTKAGLLKLGTLKRLRSLRSDVQVTPELRQCFPPNCKIDRR